MSQDKKSALLLSQNARPVSWSGYVSLALVTLFFSGLFADSEAWYGFFDFTELNGRFGTIAANFTFLGEGGSGARYGFLFALSLIPGIMLALGVVEVAEHLGALRAAQRLLTPLMRSVLGLPGVAGLALISSLQSSDAAAAMTRELHEEGLLTDEERGIFSAFQFSSGATIANYLSTGLALFAFMSVPLIVPLGVILAHKVIGTNLMRLYVRMIRTKRAEQQ